MRSQYISGYKDAPEPELGRRASSDGGSHSPESVQASFYKN